MEQTARLLWKHLKPSSTHPQSPSIFPFFSVVLVMMMMVVMMVMRLMTMTLQCGVVWPVVLQHHYTGTPPTKMVFQSAWLMLWVTTCSSQHDWQCQSTQSRLDLNIALCERQIPANGNHVLSSWRYQDSILQTGGRDRRFLFCWITAAVKLTTHWENCESSAFV